MVQLLTPRRSAHASIRGYMYQALLAVERWLELGTENGPAQAILCEGDEDLDRLICDGTVASEQIKNYAGPLGIGDRVVRETLARFLLSWVTLKKQGGKRHFVFITTAPQRSPRTGIDILRLWDMPERREEVIEGVRRWARSGAGDTKAGVEKALAWIDEHAAWEEFFNSVRWRFDAPGFEEVRSDISRLLASHRVDARLHETLIDRLLARALEVSTRSRPENRLLTQPDLAEFLKLTERELAAWAATPRAVQLRRTLDEEKGLRPLLFPGHAELPPNAPPSKLLTARYEVVLFEDGGRERQLRQLSDWCEASERTSVLLLHGQGGSGKTRLLIEWCRRLRHQGWYAGFLDRDAELPLLDPIFTGLTPRLVVIDYGEARPGLVTAVLHRLGRLSGTGSPKIRLALLARTAGEWWSQIQRDDVAVEDLVLASPKPVEVTALVQAAQKRSAFVMRAAEAYAAAANCPVPEPAGEPDYSHPRFDRALYLHVEALLQVIGRGASDDPPLARILDHERRAWRAQLIESTNSRTVSQSTWRAANRSLAALTLVSGAKSEQEARSLVETVVPSARQATVEHLLDLFRRLYPGSEGRFIDPLEPDLLGEELIRQVLADDLSVLDRILDRVSKQQMQAALVLVGRLLLDEALPPALAERVMDRIDAEPHLPVSLREAAATATQKVLDLHRAEHAQEDEDILIEQARLFNKLSTRLRDLGHHEKALEAVEKALAIVRELGSDYSDTLPRNLGPILNNLGVYLGELGRRAEALEAIDESVAIYRQLVDDGSDEFLPLLASGLSNQSSYLAELGRHEEAVEVSREAVTRDRDLAVERPDTYLPQLAMSLNTLSNRLAGLGHREEAVAVAEEALARGRQCAASTPDAFLPDLALILNNLGIHLLAVGRREEAIDALQESVTIRRQLAKSQPHAFLPGLAESLNNLNLVLAELGRHEEALAAIKEAVDNYRHLSNARPDAFLARFAISLTNSGLRLADMGLAEKALKPSEEAVAILRQLATGQPQTFLPDLAYGLNNLGVHLARLDRTEESVSALREAVQTLRHLAFTRPDNFLPSLADCLKNLGLSLKDLGRAEEALSATEEALQILAPFYLQRPEGFSSEMDTIVQAYRSRCDECDTTPNRDLLEPIEEILSGAGQKNLADSKENLR